MTSELDTKDTVDASESVASIRNKCDACSGDGKYIAKKRKQVLYFCGHHIRNHESSLLDAKFKIQPEDYSFEK